MPRPLLRRLLPRRRRQRLAAALLVLLVLARPLPTNESEQHRSVVAARDLTVGSRIAAGDLRTVPSDRPVDDDDVRDPVGRVVREQIFEGEALRAERLGGSGGELSELLDVDERAVQLPAAMAVPGTATGDLLDLAVRDAHRVQVVATGVRVVALDDVALVVGVKASAAARAGAVAEDGSLVVLLAPAP